MGSRSDLKHDVQATTAGHHGPAGGVQAALPGVWRRLVDGRDRLGDAAADAADELRDDAGEGIHQVRRRARRVRRRALRRARGGRWRGPALALAALAGASTIGVALVKGRRSLRSVVESGAKKAHDVAGRRQARRAARSGDEPGDGGEGSHQPGAPATHGS